MVLTTINLWNQSETNKSITIFLQQNNQNASIRLIINRLTLLTFYTPKVLQIQLLPSIKSHSEAKNRFRSIDGLHFFTPTRLRNFSPTENQPEPTTRPDHIMHIIHQSLLAATGNGGHQLFPDELLPKNGATPDGKSGAYLHWNHHRADRKRLH